MSIKVMTQVWELDLPLTEKMVLLVLADHANEDGSEARPAVATIARKASIDRRTVQRALRSLETRGAIEVQRQSAQHRCTWWRIRQGRQDGTPEKDARGGTDVVRGGTGASEGRSSAALTVLTRPEPPLAPNGARVDLKNALLEACGYSRESVTSPQWGAIENAAKNLADVGASPAEVLKRARLYRSKNPEWKLTPSALAKWWADLSPASGTPRGSTYTR